MDGQRGGEPPQREDAAPALGLGSLEERVMDAVWSAGAISIREVWDRIRGEHAVTFNTVMTVMNRLVRKGLLVREGTRGSYTYRPARSRSQYATALSRRLNRDLVHRFGPAAIAGFVESLEEVSPQYLEALQRFVEEHRSGRPPGKGGSGEDGP